jgi:hypothetical protein
MCVKTLRRLISGAHATRVRQHSERPEKLLGS